MNFGPAFSLINILSIALTVKNKFADSKVMFKYLKFSRNTTLTMIQVSISLVVTLHLRPLRSTDRVGVERYACCVYTEQPLILSDVTTKLLVTWIICHILQNLISQPSVGSSVVAADVKYY